jgi:phosphoribosyl-AMP cyclohydrolase / phosphoribosyl-ATP pyrophosphohydrolase
VQLYAVGCSSLLRRSAFRPSSYLREHSTVQVLSIHYDCDKDAIVYLSEPTGPSCHTGSDTCWYRAVTLEGNQVKLSGGEKLPDSVPRTSLRELEHIIQERKQQAAAAAATEGV